MTFKVKNRIPSQGISNFKILLLLYGHVSNSNEKTRKIIKNVAFLHHYHHQQFLS